jgi:hypothetical protein
MVGIGRGWKGKHVGGLASSAEALVQGFHLGVRGDEDVDGAAQASRTAGAGDEAHERQSTQTGNGLLKDYQVTPEAKASMQKRLCTAALKRCATEKQFKKLNPATGSPHNIKAKGGTLGAPSLTDSDSD